MLGRQGGEITAGGELLFDLFALLFVVDEDMTGRCECHDLCSNPCGGEETALLPGLLAPDHRGDVVLALNRPAAGAVTGLAFIIDTRGGLPRPCAAAERPRAMVSRASKKGTGTARRRFPSDNSPVLLEAQSPFSTAR